jgi:uncharacterized protein (TIGR02145 family)
MRNKNTIRIISLIALLYFSSCKNSSQKQKDFEFDIITIEKSENSGVIREVRIQNQTWSKMNINISKLLDGREIKYCKSCNELKNAFENQIPAYCYLNFDIKNAQLGKLYNYYVVFDSVGIAPKGWKIPSVNDYETLVKAHGKITKNDMGQISYVFNDFSFKAPSYTDRNKKSIGFDAFLLGNTDSDYDCQFVEGISDFWTKTIASSNPEDWNLKDELKGFFYDSRQTIIIARFQDNTDENLRFRSEGFYLFPGANTKTLMPLRLIKESKN